MRAMGRIRRGASGLLILWLVLALPIEGYLVACYLDPRGVAGDREASFPGLYLTCAVGWAVVIVTVSWILVISLVKAGK